jgi:hypothetical protein
MDPRIEYGMGVFAAFYSIGSRLSSRVDASLR